VFIMEKDSCMCVFSSPFFSIDLEVFGLHIGRVESFGRLGLLSNCNSLTLERCLIVSVLDFFI
jgi:hypothetical protein